MLFALPDPLLCLVMNKNMFKPKENMASSK